MRKLFRQILVCMCIAAVFWTLMLIRNKHLLSESMIHLHVVANSNSKFDREVKLEIRDAVINVIQKDLSCISDMQEAKAYLEGNIPKIRDIVNKTLRLYGLNDNARVSLCKESFSVMKKDKSALSSYIYGFLRISISERKGEKMGCFIFPELYEAGISS